MNILSHKQSGVYEIYNTRNGHRYIGSAVYIGRRWKNHLQQLRKNKHHSRYLQRAFNLYGESSFVFRIIEECSVDDLIKIEQKYIDRLKPAYNISLIAGSPKGVKHTEETRKKVGAASRGNKYRLGTKQSDEFKKNLSLRMIGNKINLGRKLSEETKEKIRRKAMGRNLGRKPWLGKKHKEEDKQKISKALKGKPKTEEHKQHLREARKRYLESKRDNVDR